MATTTDSPSNATNGTRRLQEDKAPAGDGVAADAKVEFSITIANIDFAALNSDAFLIQAFRAALQTTISQHVENGVEFNAVDVEVNPGSVVALVLITPPPGTATAVRDKINERDLNGNQPLQAAILMSINTIQGIDSAVMGAVSITSLTSPTFLTTQAPTTTTTVGNGLIVQELVFRWNVRQLTEVLDDNPLGEAPTPAQNILNGYNALRTPRLEIGAQLLPVGLYIFTVIIIYVCIYIYIYMYTYIIYIYTLYICIIIDNNNDNDNDNDMNNNTNNSNDNNNDDNSNEIIVIVTMMLITI